MARKLSEEQVQAYNKLVDAGRHMEARAFLATSINPNMPASTTQQPRWPSIKPLARSLSIDGPKPAPAPVSSKAVIEPTSTQGAPAATVTNPPKSAAPEETKKKVSPGKPTQYKPAACRPCFKAFRKKQK